MQKNFPRFSSFIKPTVTALYTDLLEALAKTKDFPFTQKCQNRLKQLGKNRNAKGRLILFWNIDDTDIDLHVKEHNGFEVSYTKKKSPTGGRLFWDNTTGLGPELYEHPTLAQQGFRVLVNYFSQRSIEGQAPATTLVMAFVDDRVSWHTNILGETKGKKKKVSIIDNWQPY